jgi:hypothetical protein
MHQLVYVSSASPDLSEDDLQDILSCARATNRELDITGMLVYLDGYFLQVLEGRTECVRELYARIEADPHHTGAKVLIESDVAKRAFPDWSMGFRKASRNDLYMAGFFALIRRALEGRTGRADARILRTIVKTFYRASNVPELRTECEPVLSLA